MRVHVAVALVIAACDVVVLASGMSGHVTFEPTEYVRVAVRPGSRWLVARGGGARSEKHYAIAPLAAVDRSGAGNTPWRTVAEYADEVEADPVIHGDRVYLLTTHGASNRRIVSVAAANPDLATARVELAEDPGGREIVVEELEATSVDGTRVPLSILHGKNTPHDGARPAVVYGYGGYGASQTPNFSPPRLAWLERGGVFAVCHVRGGSEKGHAWQLAGMRENKMNGVHDFEACAQALIDRRLSSPSHLFAQGGSMGGILVGRAITDRPDLFAAANLQVGLLNPLRLHAARSGVSQIPEVGDPETEAGFRAVYAMDPYQHVTAAAYPAVLFSIGLNDFRVSPWMSGKMAARLRAQTTSGRPVLIRADADGGHGPGATRDQAFAQRADEWSFFLAASGDPEFSPR